MVHMAAVQREAGGVCDQRHHSNLRCPRNGQTDEPFGSASVHTATADPEQVCGKATEVVSVSPDTGQHGGDARVSP